jgi:hypothetical protein
MLYHTHLFDSRHTSFHQSNSPSPVRDSCAYSIDSYYLSSDRDAVDTAQSSMYSVPLDETMGDMSTKKGTFAPSSTYSSVMDGNGSTFDEKSFFGHSSKRVDASSGGDRWR